MKVEWDVGIRWTPRTRKLVQATLVWTLIMAPLVSMLTGFDCMLFYLTIFPMSTQTFFSKPPVSQTEKKCFLTHPLFTQINITLLLTIYKKTVCRLNGS